MLYTACPFNAFLFLFPRRAVFYVRTLKFPDNEYVIFRTRDHFGMRNLNRGSRSLRGFPPRGRFVRYAGDYDAAREAIAVIIAVEKWDKRRNFINDRSLPRALARLRLRERFNLPNFVNISSAKARRQFEKLIPRPGPGVRARPGKTANVIIDTRYEQSAAACAARSRQLLKFRHANPQIFNDYSVQSAPGFDGICISICYGLLKSKINIRSVHGKFLGIFERIRSGFLF